MHFIQWDNGIRIGVEEIDNDHRHLIGLINTFSQAREDGQSAAVLSDLLEKLKKYSIEHFEREEAYMLKTGYLRYVEHQEQHLQFIRKVIEFDNEFQMDKELLAIKIMPFMMNWLIDHIMTSDKELAGVKEHVS